MEEYFLWLKKMLPISWTTLKPELVELTKPMHIGYMIQYIYSKGIKVLHFDSKNCFEIYDLLVFKIEEIERLELLKRM